MHSTDNNYSKTHYLQENQKPSHVLLPLFLRSFRGIVLLELRWACSTISVRSPVPLGEDGPKFVGVHARDDNIPEGIDLFVFPDGVVLQPARNAQPCISHCPLIGY